MIQSNQLVYYIENVTWLHGNMKFILSVFWEFSRIESNSAGIRILDIGSNSCTLVVGYIM